METRSWAERILFGDSVDDKLFPAIDLSDADPGQAIALPEFPNRPQALRRRTSKGPSAFPQLSEVGEDHTRGRILHFFANHELLALELMALMLLRFPDGTPGFRSSLVETISDEQRHLKLYLQRMDALGVELGEMPVNGFFWDTIAHVDTPTDFDVRMGMTFEQANLDHALFYAQRFAEIGDQESARIMRSILADEIKHVNHGLERFRQQRPANQTDWEAYVAALPDGLMPTRAKGTIYSRSLRRSAGFDRDYIDRLEVAGHSKGRPPTVWLYNPNCEAEVAFGGPDVQANARTDRVTADLSVITTYLGVQGDIVLTPRRPTTGFLRTLQSAGFDAVQYVETDLSKDDPSLSALQRRKLGRLAPWGWSPQTTATLERLVSAQVLSTTGPTAFRTEWADLHAKTTHASWAQAWLSTERKALESNGEWLVPDAHLPQHCRTLSDVFRRVHDLSDFSVYRVKTAFGAAGQGQIRLMGEPEGNQVRWLEKRLKRDGGVTVEPEFERLIDLSFHYDRHAQDGVVFKGLRRFLSDAHGRYRGVVLSRHGSGLPSEGSRFLHGDGRDTGRLERAAQALGRGLEGRLKEAAYTGPIGVDAFVYRDREGALRLQPCVEINPRWTMGRVGLRLSRRISSTCASVWLQLPIAKVGGSDQLKAWLATHPVKQDRFGLICGGVLPTNDPAHATDWLTVIVTAKDWAALKACTQPLGDPLGPFWAEQA